MKTTITTIIIAVLSITALHAQTKTYSGAWFIVKHPSSFTAKGSLESETAGDGKFDSATFTSPDGTVEFYIFAPQWRGEPTDIVLRPGERESAREVKKGKKLTVTSWTISGKNNAYARSYQHTLENQSKAEWVVGIKYKNAAALKKYRKEYLDFKASLEQYTDN